MKESNAKKDSQPTQQPRYKLTDEINIFGLIWQTLENKEAQGDNEDIVWQTRNYETMQMKMKWTLAIAP